MKISISFLLFLIISLPSIASAQWTFNPLYKVGTPSYTYDAVTQESYKLSQVPQPMQPRGQSMVMGQPQRLDNRTVRPIDKHTDISGASRFNVRERPGY